MNHSTFPLNYIRSIWTPKKAFKNRKQLNWFQLFLIFVLLTLIMVIPVFSHYQNIDYFRITDFYPNVAELIDEETINILNQAEYSNGELQTSESGYLKESDQGMVTVGVSQNELPDIDENNNFLLFGSNGFTVGDETGSVETINYTEDFSLNNATNQEDVILELSEQYTAQNRGSIVMTFTFAIYLFILGASLFIVFVYAYLLTLFKDFTLSDIQTYKEAVNLILNLIGIPTLVAFFYSFYRFNIITMLAIQIIGLIIMLLILYKQTKFQDAAFENK